MRSDIKIVLGRVYLLGNGDHNEKHTAFRGCRVIKVRSSTDNPTTIKIHDLYFSRQVPKGWYASEEKVSVDVGAVIVPLAQAESKSHVCLTTSSSGTPVCIMVSNTFMEEIPSAQ